MLFYTSTVPRVTWYWLGQNCLYASSVGLPFRYVVSRWGLPRELLFSLLWINRDMRISSRTCLRNYRCMPDGKFHLIKVGSLLDPCATWPHMAPLPDRRLAGYNFELLLKVRWPFDGSVGLCRQLRGYNDLLIVAKWNERPGQRFAQRVNRVVASRFQIVPVQEWKGPGIHQWQGDVSEQTDSRQGAHSPESLIMSYCLPCSWFEGAQSKQLRCWGYARTSAVRCSCSSQIVHVLIQASWDLELWWETRAAFSLSWKWNDKPGAHEQVLGSLSTTGPTAVLFIEQPAEATSSADLSDLLWTLLPETPLAPNSLLILKW